jgi:hypothetical protein
VSRGSVTRGGVKELGIDGLAYQKYTARRVAAERKNISIQQIVSKLSQIPRLKRKKSKDELFLVINGESKIPSPLLSLSSKSLLSNLSGYMGCQPAAHTKPSKSSRESGRGWWESTVYVVWEHSMQEFRGSARITGHLPPGSIKGTRCPEPE